MISVSGALQGYQQKNPVLTLAGFATVVKLRWSGW